MSRDESRATLRAVIANEQAKHPIGSVVSHGDSPDLGRVVKHLPTAYTLVSTEEFDGRKTRASVPTSGLSQSARS